MADKIDQWNTFDLHKDGQPFWFPRVAEKFLRSARVLGLPSEATTGKLVIGMPTLALQATISRGDNVTKPSDVSTPGIIKYV